MTTRFHDRFNVFSQCLNMYYHATATGEVLCSDEPLEAIAFHLTDSQDCIIHSNATNPIQAIQGREGILLRMTQRRLEAWLMQVC